MCTMVRHRSCVSIPLVSNKMGSSSLVLSPSVGGESSGVSGGDNDCGKSLDAGEGLGRSREVDGFGSGVNKNSSVESEDIGRLGTGLRDNASTFVFAFPALYTIW